MKRLDDAQRSALHLTIGACPSCAVFATGLDHGRTVIYRRSNTSVTMRCETCGLQWTMTWDKIHAAMKRRLAADHEEALTVFYEGMAEMTAAP